MIIRPEDSKDYSKILKLTYEAFSTLDYPGRKRMDEHFLVHLLQDSQFVVSELRFVAELNGDIVGHIIYTKSQVHRPDGSVIGTITFGPLSVEPKNHKQGIGAALVKYSMDKACDMGFGAVLITGIPEYYPKLGFKRWQDFGLTMPDGTTDDAFMAYELVPGYLAGGGTVHFLAPEFERAENDDAGFSKFHKEFMVKYYPQKLTL